MVEISPMIPEITGVRSQTFHRYVVASADVTPDNVQAFLDNSKAPKKGWRML